MAVANRMGLDGYVTPWFMQQQRGSDLALWGAGSSYLISTFWGRFGSLRVHMPAWWEWIWHGLALLALGGLLNLALRRGNHLIAWQAAKGVLFTAAAALVLLLAQVVAPLLNRPDPNWLPQGRFLLPAIAPIALLLYTGWQALLPRAWGRSLFPVALVLLVALDGLALWVLLAHVTCSGAG
jgi:hypothetical protein